jgi:hypothetical protein
MIRVFADFNNACIHGHVRLNTQGTLADLAALGIKLHAGMQIVLDDAEEFVADGVVRWCPDDGWAAEIDWDRLLTEKGNNVT